MPVSAHGAPPEPTEACDDDEDAWLLVTIDAPDEVWELDDLLEEDAPLPPLPPSPPTCW
jgi:hypothetical protein